jgi:hypothetical protein
MEVRERVVLRAFRLVRRACAASARGLARLVGGGLGELLGLTGRATGPLVAPI